MDMIDITVMPVDVMSAKDVERRVDDNSIIDSVYNALPTGLGNSYLASIIISLDINNT